VLEGFAALSLLLAGIGIHGLLSYAVSQRRSEIGLRMALGARSTDILGMIVRQGMVLAAIGAVLGVLVAYAAGRRMEGLLAAFRAIRVDAASVMRAE